MMKFDCLLKPFLESVKAVSPSVSSPSAVIGSPNVFIKAIRGEKSGEIHIHSSGSSSWITHILRDVNVSEEGVSSIDYAKLKKIISSSDDDKFKYSESDGITTIQSGATYRLPSSDPSLFPLMSVTGVKPGWKINSSSLLNSIKSTSFAADPDSTRANISGCFFDLELDSPRVVATDGKRIALFELDIENTGGIIPDGFRPQIPINECKIICSSIQIDDSETLLYFDQTGSIAHFVNGNTSVHTRMIATGFPKYGNAEPKSRVVAATTFPIESLKRIIDQSSVITSKTGNTVCFKLSSGRLEISTSRQDHGSVVSSINSSYSGPDVVFYINPIYASEFFNNIKSKSSVYIEIRGKTDIIIMRSGEKYTYWLCPVNPDYVD